MMVRFATGTLIGFFMLWLAGCLFFFNSINAMSPAKSTPPADAIIVLTGGPDRINTGIDLLATGTVSDLFISGVNDNVTTDKLLSFWDNDSKQDAPCCITLGHRAQNTRQNAMEVRQWIEKTGKAVSSAYLVTANYHMPRANIEIKYALPGIAIRPYPVISGYDPFLTVFGEYNKTLLSWMTLQVKE